MTSPATSSTDMPCTCTPIGQCACCARGPECGATTSLLACSARFKQTFARPARHPRRGGCRRARCRRTRTTPSLRQGPSRCTVPCDHALHISAADRQRRRPSAQPHLRVRRIRRTTSTRARTFRSLEHEAHAREVLVHGGEGAWLRGSLCPFSSISGCALSHCSRLQLGPLVLSTEVLLCPLYEVGTEEFFCSTGHWYKRSVPMSYHYDCVTKNSDVSLY